MTTEPIVLVTGGASGIGLAIVQAIVEQGWHAVIADLSPAALDAPPRNSSDSERLFTVNN